MKYALVLFFFSASCGQINSPKNNVVKYKNGLEVFTNQIALDLSSQNINNVIKESSRKKAFLDFSKDSIFQLLTNLEVNYQIEECFKHWEVYEENNYVIVSGLATKHEKQGYLFTLLYKDNGNGNFSLEFVQIGEKILQGEYPKNTIPYKIS